MAGVPRVVCFDADQTLVDFRSAMLEALERTLSRIRAIISSAENLSVQRLVTDRNEAAAAMGARASMEEIRLEGFRRSLAPLGATAETIRSVTDGYLADRFRFAKPYADVIPTLDILRERYTLGLATNGNSYADRLGLASYFAFTIYAHDCGFRKPDPRFFETVRRAAGCPASELAYVGDSPEEDILGARRVGFRTVWINRTPAQAWSTPARPDAEINDLSELPAVLDASC